MTDSPSGTIQELPESRIPHQLLGDDRSGDAESLRWRALVDSLRAESARIGGESGPALAVEARPDAAAHSPGSGVRRPTAAAVITSFNKQDALLRNLDAIRAQSVAFDEVIVVDNLSTDGTIETLRRDYPEVTLIVMPHDGYGACETFNIGFRNASSEFIAILDDDVELSPRWLELMLDRFAIEPRSTAIISSKVVEPEMPQWYLDHPEVNRVRYMATFRGCASLARRTVLEECRYYDEHFFIYGNERDLAARVLNRDHRILQYPLAVVNHATPFGMKRSSRSLYFHVRNLWWYLFKHVGFWQIIHFFAIQLMLKVGFRKETIRADAIGTIGIYQVIRETSRGWWVVTKATLAAFAGLPRCLREREVCSKPDFSLPTK